MQVFKKKVAKFKYSQDSNKVFFIKYFKLNRLNKQLFIKLFLFKFNNNNSNFLQKIIYICLIISKVV